MLNIQINSLSGSVIPGKDKPFLVQHVDNLYQFQAAFAAQLNRLDAYLMRVVGPFPETPFERLPRDENTRCIMSELFDRETELAQLNLRLSTLLDRLEGF